MRSDRGYLDPEDYIEPRCLLSGERYGSASSVIPVPQQRIIEKMNEYMSRRDYDGAERHLLYWLEEAKLGRDLRGQLLLENELIGHYRKVGDRERAFMACEKALALLCEPGFEGSVSSGTTYTNAATAYNAFGVNDKAIGLFEKARTVYEKNPMTEPQLLGGLYNNMALVYAAQRDFDTAFDLYKQAYDIMGNVENGALEQAITCLNTANAVEDQVGMENGEAQIFELLDKAWELLDSHDVKRDGYYAFVCEKCAPTFSYYGYFLVSDELKKRSEQIYERD